MKDHTELIAASIQATSWYGFDSGKPCKTADLLGKTFHTVLQLEDRHVCFINDTDTYVYWHIQNCCEDVRIESVVGELKDLENSPLTMAELSVSSGPVSEWGNSTTWSFYKFATIKGYVDIRWCGSSNGCYSESVDMLHKPTAELLSEGTKA